GHHAAVPRPQFATRLARAPDRQSARSADRRGRRHGRPRLSALMAATVMSDAISRGRLKVFLGYAAGVGKTYQMLSEAQALKREGVDVAIGYFEPHAPKDTIALTEGLDAVPIKTIEYRGSQFHEMDTDAILQRHPQVAI